MLRKFFIGILSGTSLCTGVYIGTKLERQKTEIIVSDNDNSYDFSGTQAGDFSQFLPIPTIYAKTILADNQNQLQIQKPVQINIQKPAAQLAKVGYPTYENLRTFDDFIVSYDKRNRCPNWVLEHLTKEKVARNEEIERKEVFCEDATIHPYFRATNEDYRGSGYDRGHLAAAANHRWSQTAMNQTFHLSNIAPQVGKGFNRDAWNSLEQHIRKLARRFSNVYVVTGPLYLPRLEADGKMYVKYEVIGKNHVSVPTHFYKVVACETDSKDFRLFSYVMPNQKLPAKVDVQSFQVPLETIERAAGYMFFGIVPKNKVRSINDK